MKRHILMCLTCAASTAVAGVAIAGGRAAAQSATPPATRQFVLRQILFDDVHVLPITALDPVWRGRADKTVSFEDLKTIARSVEAVYAAHGYPFTAVVVPPQSLKNGVVHLKVIEGRIGSVLIVGADPVARRQASAMFDPLKAINPLPGARLDRQVLAARNIPGLTTTSSLGPGTDIGSMELVVKTSRTEWAASADLTNGYARSLGRWAASAQLSRSGESAFGDQTTALVLTSPDLDRQKMLRLSHMRGLNDAGTSVGVNVAVASANPKGSFANLNIASDILNIRGEVDQVILLTPDVSLNGSAGFEWNDQSTDVFTSTALTRDRLRVVSLGLSGTIAAPQTALGWSVEVRQGLDLANSSQKSDLRLSRAGGDPNADVIKGALSIQRRLWNGAIGSLRLQGQYASRPLLVPEQFSLGNLSIVRGYEPSALLGDRVVAGAFELRSPAIKAPCNAKLDVFGFVDGGQLWTLGPNGQSRWATSRGLGVGLDLPNTLHADLTYADAQRVGPIPGGSQVLFSLHAPLEHFAPLFSDTFKAMTRARH